MEKHLDAGRLIFIDPMTIKMDGLKKVMFNCDNNDMVDAALIVLDLDRYDATYKNLTSKYGYPSDKNSYGRHKIYEFEAGESVITLEAPLFSHETHIDYKSKKLIAQLQDKLIKQREQEELNRLNEQKLL